MPHVLPSKPPPPHSRPHQVRALRARYVFDGSTRPSRSSSTRPAVTSTLDTTPRALVAALVSAAARERPGTVVNNRRPRGDGTGARARGFFPPDVVAVYAVCYSPLRPSRWGRDRAKGSGGCGEGGIIYGARRAMAPSTVASRSGCGLGDSADGSARRDRLGNRRGVGVTAVAPTAAKPGGRHDTSAGYQNPAFGHGHRDPLTSAHGHRGGELSRRGALPRGCLTGLVAPESPSVGGAIGHRFRAAAPAGRGVGGTEQFAMRKSRSPR